ncbi:MAG TPA: WYL domain-containing protein [Nitrospiraceae bacterium]|nr:WYL domain-containing protein [Nitrospiraceae bacterium]
MKEISKPRGRQPKPYNQADRLTRMMRALASRSVTLNDLVQEFGVTRRQVYRDLERIQEQGHPLEQNGVGSDRTWRLPLGYKGLPPITLSPYELMSLQLARACLSYLDGTSFVEDLDQTLAKLRASLPDKTLNHLDRLVQVFAPLSKPIRKYGAQASLLRELRKALLLQLTVELDYVKPGDSGPSRYRVDPYALVLHQHALYLATYSYTSAGDRLFLVDRMKTIALSDERFDLPTEYSAPERFGKLFGLMDEAPHEIQLHVGADAAHFFRESQWHASQQITPEKEGSLLVTFTAGGLEEIARWVLSWGKEVKVLSPPELVQLVKEQITKSLQHYDDR